MPKRILSYSLLVLFALIQTAAGRYIRIFGVLPNIALCYTAVYALTNSPVRAAPLGLLCGLMIDALSKGIFGANGLILMYFSMLASYLFGRYFFESRFCICIGAFIFTFFYELTSLLLVSVFGADAGFFYCLIRYIIPLCLINAILSLPMIILVKWLNSEYIRGI